MGDRAASENPTAAGMLAVQDSKELVGIQVSRQSAANALHSKIAVSPNHTPNHPNHRFA